MNYCNLFTAHLVALLHDWLEDAGELLVRLEWPHRGGSGTSYRIASLRELKELLAVQDHPEIEVFVFRRNDISEDELDSYLEMQWVCKNPDDVIYVTVNKNRNYYERYHDQPSRYQSVVEDWVKSA